MRSVVTRNVDNGRSPWWTWLAILLVCIGGLVTTYYLFVEAPPPRRLVIATGAREGAYYRFAERYAELLKREGITLDIRMTHGSVENLRLLMDEDSDVTVAFVQTGIADPEQSGSLHALASLYREPLWIFHRGLTPIDRLTQLKGKRIGIGSEGSGTRGIALQLLKANGFQEDSDELLSLGSNDAADALEKNEIDAAFFVAGIDAEYIKRLITDQHVHLVELAHVEAYERQFRFLSSVTIHEGLLDLEHNVPSKDIELIAPAATLPQRAQTAT